MFGRVRGIPFALLLQGGGGNLLDIDMALQDHESMAYGHGVHYIFGLLGCFFLFLSSFFFLKGVGMALMPPLSLLHFDCQRHV